MKVFSAVLAGSVLAWASSFSVPASAAQLGSVQGSGAELKSQPSRVSETIETLKKGEILQLSNFPTQGFYKVRSSSGNVGWVEVGSLSSGSDDSDAPASPNAVQQDLAPEVSETIEPPTSPAHPATSIDLPERVLRYTDQSDFPQRVQPSGEERRHPLMSAFFGLQNVHLSDLNHLLGASPLSWNTDFGVQLDVPLSRHLFWSSRLEHLSGSGSDASYTYSTVSTPLTSGLSYAIYRKRGSMVRVSALIGVGIATRLDATADHQGAPNITEFSSTAFTQLAKLDMIFPVGVRTGFVFEGGYRGLASPSVGASVTGNGSSAFQVNGISRPISIDLSGVFFLGGLTLQF